MCKLIDSFAGMILGAILTVTLVGALVVEAYHDGYREAVHVCRGQMIELDRAHIFNGTNIDVPYFTQIICDPQPGNIIFAR